MSSNYNNNNLVSAVLFRLIIAALLLLFTASYPQAHAKFLGGLFTRLLPPLSIPSIPAVPFNLSLPPIPVPPLPQIPTQLPVGLNVSGQLCCAPDGNCLVQGGGQGVVGLPVTLQCTLPNGATTVGGGTTGANGAFSIITFVPAVGQLVSSFISTGGQIPCAIVIDQPALLSAIACPVLSTLSGALASLVYVTGTATNAAIETIVTATISGFINVPV